MATYYTEKFDLDEPGFQLADLNVFGGMLAPCAMIVVAILISSILVVINPGIISGISL